MLCLMKPVDGELQSYPVCVYIHDSRFVTKIDRGDSVRSNRHTSVYVSKALRERMV